MSNTTTVFENSYQPQYIGQEFLPIIYGKEAAGDNSQLYKFLQDATIYKDPNTPLYPTKEDRELIERREDITKLREQYTKQKDKHGCQHKEARRAYATLKGRIRRVLHLIVEERRTAYFKEADRRRALGESTANIPIPRGIAPDPAPHDKGAYVGQFLANRSLGGTERTSIFCGLLTHYLAHRVTQLQRTMASLTASQDPNPTDPSDNRWICLFCQTTFANRNGLTRHNRVQHYLKGTFNQPLHCPICPDFMINSAEEWSSHTARRHGLQYAPG